MHKIILFELNEVPQKIVDYYRQVRPDSWLAQNYSTLKKFNSFSENSGQLNPWNTWPTVHRGVDSSKHKILDLNQRLDEQDREYPTIWKNLESAGLSVGVFGSLHSYPTPKSQGNYEFYVPDAFARSAECLPKKISAFQEVNLELSRKSARNVSRKIPKKALFNLAFKLPTLGIKTRTVRTVGNQLLDERRESWKSTRRRTVQSILNFDIFYALLRQKKPDFVTFYTNHVAACLHRYWAATFPSAYEINQFSDDWINRYDGEIIYALNEADKMLAKLAFFVRRNPEYKLVILSSMGQDAVKARPIFSQLYINDPQKFMHAMGVGDHFQLLPAMLPQFNFSIDPLYIETFESNAERTIINGKPLRYRTHDNGHISIEMGHINQTEIVFKIGDKQIDPGNSGLRNVPIADQSSTTANHVPEGIFYTYHPSQKPSEMQDHVLETCVIYPSLMRNFGLKPADYAAKANQLILD